MITAPFTGLSPSDAAPANDYVTITPNDSNDLNRVCRGLYIGTTGDLAIIGQPGSSAVTFSNVAAGTVLPLRASRVMATNTTAANIIALY